MFRISVLFLLICLLPFSSFAADDLEILDFRHSEYIKIFYNPKLAKVSEAGSVDIYEKTDVGLDQYILMTTSLSKDNTQKYIVYYSGGPSGDPMFIFRKDGAPVPGFVKDDMHASGTKLVIPGDGYIYISGHTNNMYDEHRKYKIENNKLVEVKQPFYSIGIDTVALRPFKIYSSEDKKSPVADIKAGEKITVVIGKAIFNDKKNRDFGRELFLIKTKNGLTGWFEIPDDGFIFPGSTNKPYFDGIFYNGD